MRLKSLEVQGYKSFASKVLFEFDGGVTAVVGPNGSGKSNVADAIRWVMGEQSFNLLRGKKTEDMIFSGSSERARLGMASVSLVLDNTDGWLPVDFSEVIISRRAYRSGENEYRLNNSRVRLRDITRLLAKGGLDRQTYTVVGQGAIDRALSLRPDERRQLFEEAAGITLHRQQRETTLKRLAQTEDNLLRVNDIVKEIEPRLRRLERQAERAAEFEQLRVRLDELLRTWYGYRWGQGQLALHEARLRADASAAELDQLRQQLTGVDHDIEQRRQEQAEQRAQIGGWHAESSALHAQAETLQRKLAVGEERSRLLLGQREEFLSELAALQASYSDQTARVGAAQDRVTAAAAEVDQVQDGLNQVQARVDAYQAQRQELASRQQEAEQRARRLTNELAQRAAQLQQLDERRAELIAQRQTCQQTLAEYGHEYETVQARQTEAQAKVASFEQQLAALAGQVAQTEAEQQVYRQTAARLERDIGTLDRKMDTLKTRQDLLARLRNDLSSYNDGVRAVLKAAQQGHLSGILGTISQLCRVPSKFEAAIEAALGSQLQNVVVENWAAAASAIANLKANRAGRATFLPLDRLHPPQPLARPDGRGVLGLASQLIEYDPVLEPAIQLLLNGTLIVADLNAARHTFKGLRGRFQIVTLAGELVLSGGAVSGGATSSNGRQGGNFLAREREWRELPAEISGLNRQRTSLEQKLAADRAQEESRASRSEELVRAEAELHRSLTETAEQLSEVRHLGQKLESAIGFQRELHANAVAALTELDGREEQTRLDLARLGQRHTEAETQVERVRTEVSNLSAESLLTELGQAKTTVAEARGRWQEQKAILENHDQGQRQFTTQIAAKQARVETLAAERNQLDVWLADLRQETEALNEQIETLAAQTGPAEARLLVLEQQQRELEKSETTQRQQLHRWESEHGRHALELARCQDHLSHLQRQIEDDLGLVELPLSEDQVGQPVLPMHPLVSELPVVEQLPTGVEEDVRRLKVQIQRLGAINPDAPSEYTELKERYDYLTSQMADLEAAIADLRQVIGELDELMETAFTGTFEKVAIAFRQYFKALFGGGEAQLLLTQPNSLTETGVDIVARPPGKRLQNLALLSGGERSLTAQALLFALLRTSPTPFVILDEVDAMLDEANVDRFRQALVDLARDIQFIIITHNRKTIEAANTIYGISMGDDSVSRVVARKLEDVSD